MTKRKKNTACTLFCKYTMMVCLKWIVNCELNTTVLFSKLLFQLTSLNVYFVPTKTKMTPHRKYIKLGFHLFCQQGTTQPVKT